MMGSEIKTDFLVVGAGPAGAALACFLGQNGLEGILIAHAPGTTDTPRAHLVNPFALECLRDIALEDDAMRMSLPPDMIGAFRYCKTLLGQEWGNVPHWEGIPENIARVKKYTPCRWVDLPQSYMEPILVKYASHHGFSPRFSTELVSAERDSETGEWLCQVKDHLRKDSYIVRTKFLFGADGGRSPVAKAAEATFASRPSLGVACNVLFDADVSHLMQGRHAQLHTIMNPAAHSRFGTGPVMRVIRPWHEWMLVSFSPGATLEQDPFRDVTPDSPELHTYLREVIGLDDNPLTTDIPIKVHRIDPWVAREVVAHNFQPAPNAFILGDAAHRHPPSFGLGSNTCVQDAYNLGWKVAYVARGLAGLGLLDSYTIERQPVGAQLVRESNAALPTHVGVWDALGMMTPDREESLRIQETFLTDAGPAGEAQRKKLADALEAKGSEGRSFGLCGNQWYVSDAVYLDDEEKPRPKLEGDPLEELQVCTYPGTRLPHAWLDVPAKRSKISTHDLAGKGAFCLFTGHGGEKWQEAAEKITKETGIPIKSYKIGLGLEWQDIYREWYTRRGVADSGCVLVRPDRFVAWRAERVLEDCQGKLMTVLDKVLSRL